MALSIAAPDYSWWINEMHKLNQGSAFDLLYNLGNKAQCPLLPFPWELLSLSESHIKMCVSTRKGYVLCQHRALSCPSTGRAPHWDLPTCCGFRLCFPGHLGCFAAAPAGCHCPRGWVRNLDADLMPGHAAVTCELCVLRPNSPQV